MQNTAWTRAIQGAADPERAKHYFERLKSTAMTAILAKANGESARILCAVLSGSQGLSEALATHPDWIPLCLDSEALRHPRQAQGLEREVRAWLAPLLEKRDSTEAFRQLRIFKQKEMLRIGARDLAGLAQVPDLILEISNVADICLQVAYEIVWQDLGRRFGLPYQQRPDESWELSAFTVFGMGKLGGQELNYSSDIDLLFVYTAEGFVFKSRPRKGEMAGRGMASHQFFKQLAETMIAELSRMSPEGAMYRIDMRLRPEGKGGPLVRSLASYENYYAQWGQTWERMMLIKARAVAGDRQLGSEFLEMIQPFRFPRSLGADVPQEVGAIKQRIENEVVKAGEIHRNVKLGRGGIREIEFIVQTHQLIGAGRMPFLQGAQTLPLLEKLAKYQILPSAESAQLAEAYVFLRSVEHRLQMEAGRQTHTIPAERKARERLAALMGERSLRDFESLLAKHTGNVRRVYEKVIKAPPPQAGQPLPPDFDEEGEAQWMNVLLANRFRDVPKGLHLARQFVQGPGFGHTSNRTAETGVSLLCQMFSLCPNAGQARPASSVTLSDPDRVLARIGAFVGAYGARAMLFETWKSNPPLFRALLLLFDRSEFLAEAAIRTPDLVESLALNGQVRRSKVADIILSELRHGQGDKDQFQWVRRYHQAEQMRIGLRDILEMADSEQSESELTALADANLGYALEVVLGNSRIKKPPFAIIGLGKLGGRELIYGSDLDIIFVAEDKPDHLPGWQALAAALMELLSKRTEDGSVFPTDTRLRPDGDKGLLVNTLSGYRDYYHKRAQLWEIQALTRARFIAGHAGIGQQFIALAGKLTDFTNPSPELVCFTSGWLAGIAHMRARIEKERTPSGKEALAIKTGAGGLMDAEFLAQALALAGGWHEPNTVGALTRAVNSGQLAAEKSKEILAAYRNLLRIEFVLRRWSFESESVLPDDPAALYRVAVRCGFDGADSLLKAVAGDRQRIRAIYSGFFK